MPTRIVSDIREHVIKYIPSVVFNYGRPADTALTSAVLDIDQWFVHLDPITFEGEFDNFERARVSIGFLLQDIPDSSYDGGDDSNLLINESIEVIQNQAKELATEWINDFLDNYKYSGVGYSFAPVTRIKNVMSGVLLTATLSYKSAC